MEHMYKGIINFTLMFCVLVISGAVLYEPIDTFVQSVAGACTDANTAAWISNLTIYFVGAIVFGIMCLFGWLFFWSHKYEYERY